MKEVGIYKNSNYDQILEVSGVAAKHYMKKLSRELGVLAGPSSGASYIRNNMANKVKAAVEGTAKEGEPTIETIDAFVSAYAASYEFNAVTAGERRVTDPLEVEAISIAREILKGALKAKGISYLKVPEEKRNAMVAEIAQKESVVKEAKKRLDAKRKAAEAALDGIDLSDLGGDAEPETAPAAAE